MAAPHADWLAQGVPVEGPAFPPLVKLLATLLVLALLVGGLRVSSDVAAVSWSWSAMGFMLATFGVIAACYWGIMRSRTGVDETAIYQHWLWPKRVALTEITQAKFIYIPYLAWLIAPRLVVKAQGRGMYVFHAADPRVLQAFARLSLGPALAPLLEARAQAQN